MAVYLKQATPGAAQSADDITRATSIMLQELEEQGEQAARRIAREFDGWTGEIVVSDEQIEAATAQLSATLKDDISFAHDSIRRFAEAQKATIGDCEVELQPGFWAGQRNIPIESAGCYVPGGRYAHVASAIMTITTAKVAGVKHISACSPPKPGSGIPAAILYTMKLCGADRILCLGGVPAVAAMAFGHFGLPKADIIVGPGNQYVAEAKRLLYGRIGIDMVAGPTDSMILADETADAGLIASDLIGQAEHGYNSPVWLVTTHEALARAVLARVPDVIAALPDGNRESAAAAWQNFAEIIVCSSREEMAQVADRYAPEHLHVQATDTDWWLSRLQSYGSLFLGEETTVAFGDKAAGPNHVLPTSGAARYTGGLSVHKFMKTVTWQRGTRDGVRRIAEATARISRLEGMEGHARSADVRLERYFPEADHRLKLPD